MQSIRRAAFRTAISASRAVSSPARSAPFAAQISRQIIAPIARPSAIISARFFSQTGRVADEEKSEEELAQGSETKRPLRENETPYGIFIRNLIYDATEEHLAGLFEKFGKIHHVSVARDAGNMSRGYGFVFFTNEQDRQEAIRNMDGTFWHGRRLAVAERLKPEATRAARRSPRASPNAPTNCLYIGNIPFETTDAELNEFFGSFSHVTDVRVAVDRTTGWPRGFCHVDFKDEEAAQEAIEVLKRKTLRDRQLKYDFAAPAQASSRGRDRREQDGSGY